MLAYKKGDGFALCCVYMFYRSSSVEVTQDESEAFVHDSRPPVQACKTSKSTHHPGI